MACRLEIVLRATQFPQVPGGGGSEEGGESVVGKRKILSVGQGERRFDGPQALHVEVVQLLDQGLQVGWFVDAGGQGAPQVVVGARVTASAATAGGAYGLWMVK